MYLADVSPGHILVFGAGRDGGTCNQATPASRLGDPGITCNDRWQFKNFKIAGRLGTVNLTHPLSVFSQEKLNELQRFTRVSRGTRDCQAISSQCATLARCASGHVRESEFRNR